MHARWKIRRPMRTRVVECENGLSLRIPRALAEEARVTEGATVEISLARGQLLVRPAAVHFDLEDLLEEVTPENPHAEAGTGGVRGSESW